MKILEKMKVMEVVESGHMMRPFHGVAYYDLEKDLRVTAVVPLNWIIAIARAMWAFLRYGSRRVANSSRDAYRQGIKEGLRMAAAKEGKRYGD